jgi:peroxiredoxin
MTVQVGATAPDFSLKGIDGQIYGLADALRRGPVALVFFKTTCGTCDLAIPYINRLNESYAAEGWSLWTVAQDPAAQAGSYASTFGISYPVLPDTDGFPVSRAFDPPATPTLFLIDPDGRIVQQSAGFSKEDLNSLSRSLAERLGVEPVAVAAPDDGNPDFKPG